LISVRRRQGESDRWRVVSRNRWRVVKQNRGRRVGRDWRRGREKGATGPVGVRTVVAFGSAV